MTGLRPRRSRRRTAALGAAIVAVACTAAGCSEPTPEPDGEPPTPLRVEIVETLPHDPDAFTQGLEIRDGALYEGTGIAGRSWLRISDFPSGAVREQEDLPGQLFGEGITVTDDSVWQLTWRDGIAVERDRNSLAEKRRVEYDGEGWGLCTRSDEFVMSDGSATLAFRDPETFAVARTVQVHDESGPVDRLNELECADDGRVYANVWTTDTIVAIDPDSGRVTEEIDAGATRRALPQDASNIDVLNGIAEIPGTDRFLVTGKYWPAMFVVRFVP